MLTRRTLNQMTMTVETPTKPDTLPALDTNSLSEASKRKLPEPSGYHLLLAIPVPDEKTESGLYKAEETKDAEIVTSIVGFVLAMGPDCYKDETRFPSGPYCKEGDFVVFKAYSGVRVQIDGREFRLISDETVRAVVDDPRGIKRVG